jgi:hypothetical protein
VAKPRTSRAAARTGIESLRLGTSPTLGDIATEALADLGEIATRTAATPHARREARQITRRNVLLTLHDQVQAGLISESTAGRALTKAGFPDSKNPWSTPKGMSVGDVVHAVARPLGLSRSTNIRREAAAQQQFIGQHGRLPTVSEIVPNTGVVGMGPGGTFGLGRQLVYQYGQAATYAPGGVAAFVSDPGRTVGRIGEHLRHPNIAEDVLLGYLAAHGVAAGTLRARAAAQSVRAGEGARAAITRSAEEGGGLLHTPWARPYTINIPGQRLQGPATAAGVVPRAPGIPIERPVIQNPLVRPFSVARSKRIEKKVTSEAPERVPGIPIGGGRRLGKGIATKARGTFGAHATVGRELRARIRVEQEIENAHAQQLARITAKLSPAERDALTVVAISGDAALTNPIAAIEQQTARHQHFIAIGGDEERNTAHIKGLQNARAVLEQRSPKFTRAVMLAREVSNRTEAKLVASGHLAAGAAAGRQAKIADIYGYDAPPPGSFYFPLSERYMDEGILPAGGFEAKPSQYGVSRPSATARVPGLKQEFTGGQLVAGRLPDVGGATAKRAQQVSNLLSVERQYDDLFRIGRPERRSEFDIPIRATADVKSDLRKFISDLSKRAERGDVDPNDLITAGDLQNLRDLIDASAQYGNRAIGPGSRIDGIRWVDRRFIAEMGPSVKGRTFRAADAITNPIRISQLYARPAYILNLAGNLGMNGISEGARVFPALKWAATAQKRMPPPVMREIDAGMGVSLSRAYSVGRGFMGQLSDKMAEFWNRLTDMHSRRAAFRAAAAREGFRTDAQIVELMTNPANEATKIRVFRQGNKNIVDYSSLTPFERDEVRRLIYFYPWVSRGTIWALRTMVEHPYKTFTLFELGQIGAENAHKQFGKNLPSWVEELGLIPIGHSGDRTKVLNPSSVWTPTTAVQAFNAGIDTAEAILGLPHSRAGWGDLATPAAELLTQSGTRYEGGPTSTGLKGLMESIPYYQAGRRGGLYGRGSQTYPERGVGPALGPLGAGGFYPRELSRYALHTQAVKAARTPKAKAKIQVAYAVENDLMTPYIGAQWINALETGSDDQVTRLRRRIGELIKNAQR